MILSNNLWIVGQPLGKLQESYWKWRCINKTCGEEEREERGERKPFYHDSGKSYRHGKCKAGKYAGYFCNFSSIIRGSALRNLSNSTRYSPSAMLQYV